MYVLKCLNILRLGKHLTRMPIGVLCLQQIKDLLEGKETNREVIEKLKVGDDALWKFLLNEAQREDIEVRFSRDLMLLLETDNRAWQFLEIYLRKAISSLKRPGTNPIFDLSNFS